MALFEQWKQNRLNSKIQKNATYLTRKTTSPEGRLQSIDILKEIGTPEAISALLQRFRLTVPELTRDEDEKDHVSSVVRQFGQKAKQPLIDFIEKHDEVMRPLRILASLLPEEELIAFLIDKLVDLDELYSSMKTIKLVEILRHLANYENPELSKIALKFIDPVYDDDVIISAVDILEKQQDPDSRLPLLNLAADPDITHRIAFRIGEMIEKLHWNLKGAENRNELEKKLSEEFTILKKGYLKQKHTHQIE